MSTHPLSLTARVIEARAISRALAARIALGVIVSVAAALRLSNFGAVAPNPFYDAAVRSMGQSWHNFFFGAFEPGASASVDKIPTDLWLQVASVKLFGFGSVALRLPAAVAGTLAVLVLYDALRRVGGRGAALASAAVLAVLPAAVLTARSDTMDSVMMALLVVTAWLTVRAVETRRTAWLVAAGTALGLAFNVKLFEALVAAPALVALFWLGSSKPLWARARALGAAAVAFVATSLAWIVSASLTPRSGRPFPIGSTDGGIWNVVFVFNGSARLSGPPTAMHRVVSPTRLFEFTGGSYGSLIGSLLAPALVLGSAALVSGLWGRVPARAALGGDDRLRRAGALAAAVWLLTGTVLFTVMRQLHLRYLEAMTPAVAIAVGAGMVALVAFAARVRFAGGLLLSVAVAASLGLALSVGLPSPGGTTTTLGLGALAALALAVGVIRRRTPFYAGAAVLALVAVLAAPTAQSVRLVRAGNADSGQPGHISPARLDAIGRYLAVHSRGLRYEVATSSALTAGPLIARDGRPVLVLTSFRARPLASTSALRRAVAKGEVRYALLRDGRCRPGSHRSPACAPAVRWARAHGTDVSRRAGLTRRGTLFRLSNHVVHR